MFKSAVQYRLKKKIPSLAPMGKEIQTSAPITVDVVRHQNKRPLELVIPEEPKKKYRFQKQQNDD